MGRIEYLRKNNKPIHNTFFTPYKLTSAQKNFRRVMSSILPPNEELVKITEDAIAENTKNKKK